MDKITPQSLRDTYKLSLSFLSRLCLNLAPFVFLSVSLSLAHAIASSLALSISITHAILFWQGIGSLLHFPFFIFIKISEYFNMCDAFSCDFRLKFLIGYSVCFDMVLIMFRCMWLWIIYCVFSMLIRCTFNACDWDDFYSCLIPFDMILTPFSMLVLSCD